MLVAHTAIRTLFLISWIAKSYGWRTWNYTVSTIAFGEPRNKKSVLTAVCATCTGTRHFNPWSYWLSPSRGKCTWVKPREYHLHGQYFRKLKNPKNHLIGLNFLKLKFWFWTEFYLQPIKFMWFMKYWLAADNEQDALRGLLIWWFEHENCEYWSGCWLEPR